MALDQQPAGLLLMYQPSEGHDRVIMHRQAEDISWVGFWTFHEGGHVAPGNFQMVNGMDPNSSTRLDGRLGRFIYRGLAINLDNGTAWEIILIHEATYIRQGAGSLWQQHWHRRS